MKTEDQKISRLEIVMVKNEEIDLFASLVLLENGKAVVHGRVILGIDKKLQFSSDTHFKGALQSEFLSACRTIADFYGADLFRYRISLQPRDLKSLSEQQIPYYLLN